MENQDKNKTANVFPTSVNNQITDSVTQSNVKVVGESPAMALGNVYQSAAHSTGIMFENAVNNQNQQNILGQAAANQGVMQIYSLDTTTTSGATEQLWNESDQNLIKKNQDKDKK